MKKKLLPALAALCVLIALFISCSKSGGGKITNPDTFGTRGTIKGRVLDDDGKPVSGVIVTANSDSSTPGVSDDSGYFEVGSVLPGTYNLRFVHPDWKSAKTIEVTVVKGQKLTLDSPVLLKSAFYTIKGKVINGQNQAIGGSGVAIARTNLSGLTDADGTFMLERVPKTLSKISLLAAKSQFGFVSITIIPDKKDVIEVADILLKTGGINVSGRVLDPDGTPMSGVVVQAIGPGLQDTTNARGEYILQNIPSNEDGVRIKVPPLEKMSLEGAIMGFKATGDISGLDITLHAIPLKKNGMLLETTDLVVPENQDSVELSVFPKSDTGVVIMGYEWSAGGKAIAKTDEPTLGSSVQSLLPAAKRSASGTFKKVTVTVVSINSDGNKSAEHSMQVSIRPDKPELIAAGASTSMDTLAHDTVHVTVKEQVNFSVLAFDPFGGLASISLDPGDSTGIINVKTDSSLRVKHTYLKTGTYTAIIKVTDTDSNSVSKKLQIIVENSSVEVPTNIFPPNGYTSYFAKDTVTFEWQAVQGANIKYALILDDVNDPPFKRVKEGLTTNRVSIIIDSGKVYQWRVEASSGGKTAYSEVWTIRGKTNVKTLDFLVEPKQDSMLKNWSVSLSWKTAPKAKFRLHLGLNYTALTPVGNYDDFIYSSGSNNTKFYSKSGLQGNRIYFWQVSMMDSTGEEVFSPIRVFRTPNHPPEIPTPYSPSGINVLTNNSIHFKWNYYYSNQAKDQDANDTVSYLIYLDKQDPPAKIIATVRDTMEFDFKAGVPDAGKYYWRVAAWDGRDTVFQTYGAYTFNANNPPVITETAKDMEDTLTPGIAYVDTLHATDPDKNTLYWEAVSKISGFSIDYYTGVLTFNTYFTTDTTLTVRVFDNAGGADTLSWRVKVVAPDADPQISPANDTTFAGRGNNSFRFQWKTLRGYSYQFCFSTAAADLDKDTINSYTAYYYSTQIDYDYLIPGYGTYYWKVHIKDSEGKVISSSVRKLTVTPPDVSNPLILPAKDTTIAGGSVQFRWSRYDGYTQTLLAGTDSTKLDTLTGYQYDATGYRYSNNNLQGNRTCYWRIVIMDAKKNTFSSPIRKFNTLNQKPTVPGLTYPVNVTVKRNASVDLQWNQSTDPDGDTLTYLVYFEKKNTAPANVLVGTVVDTGRYTIANLDSAGYYYWRVGVTDGKDTAWGYNSYWLYSNTEPVFTTAANRTPSATARYAYLDSLTSKDTDGDALTYSLLTAPTGMTIGGSNGVVNWIPKLTPLGNQSVSARVADGRGWADTLNWTVNVTTPTGSWKAPAQGMTVTQADNCKIRFAASNGWGFMAYIDVNNGYKATVRRSTDGGNNWNALGSALSGGRVNHIQMALFDTIPYVLYQMNNNDSLYVEKWNGGNSTWDTVGYPYPASLGKAATSTGPHGYSDIEMNGDTVYVAYRTTTGAGLVRKYNFGWSDVGTAFAANAEYIDLHIKSNNLYVGFRNSGSTNKISAVMWTGNAWNSMGGGSLPTSMGAEQVRMTSDPSGNMYLAYRNTTTGKASVLKNDGTLAGTWSFVGGSASENFSRTIDYLYALKVDNSGTVSVLTRENNPIDYSTYYFPSVYTYTTSWGYLAYPWFWHYEEAGGTYYSTVEYMDMDLKSGVPWVVFRDENASGKPATIMNYSP